MRVRRYTDLPAFSERVTPYLAAAEAQNCLPLGILASLAANPGQFDSEPYMACVEDDSGDITLVALRTPPHNLILSLPASPEQTPAALAAIARDARAVFKVLPGVVACDDLASRFAEIWSALTGKRARPGIQERIYRLSQVRWPRSVAGAMRHIEERDRETLRVWLHAFMLEALGDDVQSVDGMIDNRLRAGASGMYLWEDRQPVSLAGFGGPTPHGIRLGPVYTPPEARGRGYASALVAQVSQRLLDEGRQYCFLFTDLANHTSNHIYQEIGYEEVCDAAEFKFDGAPGQT
jgi:uncharacterized protein